MSTITSRFVRGWLALFLVVATLLGGAPAASAAPDEPAAELPKTLKVGTEGVYPPFSYEKDGELTGFDVDVMRAVGEKLGVEIEFVKVQWDSMFEALKSGRVDMVANQVNINPERKALYDLSDPYVDTTGVVVVAEDNSDIKGVKDIRGKRAAQNVTSSWAEVAKKNGADIVAVDSVDKAIENLRNGRVDVVVNDKLAANFAIKTLGDNAGVKVVAETDDRAQSALAARKGTGYMPQINQALKELEDEGTIDAIYDEYFAAEASPPTDWELVKQNAWPMLVAGVKISLSLTVLSFALGLVIGLGLALSRMSKHPWLSGPTKAYIGLFRGIPVLVLLLFVFFGPSQFGLNLPPYLAAVITFTLNASAYCAEVIRGSLQSVPSGQWEAARTIGMDARTALRRIIVPQALRSAVPPLSNTMIELLKSTSLVSVILLTDPLRRAQFAAAPTFKFFTMYLLAGLVYLALVLLLTAVQNRIESRVSRFAS